MQVIRTKRFDETFTKLPANIKRKDIEQLLRLETDPHHPSLHTHKRAGQHNLWQAGITQDYRLFFVMEGDTITLVSVESTEK